MFVVADIDMMMLNIVDYCLIVDLMFVDLDLMFVDLDLMTKADQLLRYSVDGEYGQITPPKVVSVDPVGSGDAFTGGAIAGLLSGLTVDKALTQGSIRGASVASMFGDWTGIPRGRALSSLRGSLRFTA